jgi:class 3 adenylate cyclase
MTLLEHRQVVLFADLCGSTALYERLGDAAARRLVADCLARAMAVVRANGGRVVKTIGDEILATFQAADAAAATAEDIVRTLQGETVAPGTGLRAHVGFHLGPVIEEDDDVFGDTVNVAARVVGLAKVGEILTTRPVVDALSPSWRPHVRPINRLPIRGSERELEIFALAPQSPDTTVISPPSRRARPTLRLVIEHAGREYRVDELEPLLTIGRAPDNHLVLAGPLVSRYHARVVLRNGQFVLFDESSNGTAVGGADGSTMFVHRESLTLLGDGLLAPGADVATEPSVTVRFRVG